MHRDHRDTPVAAAPRRVVHRGRRLRPRQQAAVASTLAVGLLVAGIWAVIGPAGRSRAVATDPTPTVTAFAVSLYPRPVTPAGPGSVSFPGRFMCPSLSGVQAPPTGSSPGVLATLNGLLHAPTKTRAQVFADRAGWPLLGSGFILDATKATFTPTDVAISPAASYQSTATYQSFCGAALVDDSLVAVWCTSSTTGQPLTPAACASTQPAMTNASLFLDRHGHWLLWGMTPTSLPVRSPATCGPWSAATAPTGRAIAAAHGPVRACMKVGTDWVIATVNTPSPPGAIGVRRCGTNPTCLDGRNDPGPNAFTWYTPPGLPSSAITILGRSGSHLIVDAAGHQLLFDPATGSFTPDNVGTTP